MLVNISFIPNQNYSDLTYNNKPVTLIRHFGFVGHDYNQLIITQTYKTVPNLRFIFNLETNVLISLQDIAESQNED